jgi:hypothetical protein
VPQLADNLIWTNMPTGDRFGLWRLIHALTRRRCRRCDGLDA